MEAEDKTTPPLFAAIANDSFIKMNSQFDRDIQTMMTTTNGLITELTTRTSITKTTR